MNTSNITFNNVSFKNCTYKPDSDLEWNAKYITLVFVCLFGILSNVFIILCALKYTVRKNLHHLIINMAVSDALLLVSILWNQVFYKYIIESLYSDGVMGAVLCKIKYFGEIMFCHVSLLTLLVISIVRFRATRLTLQRPRPSTLKQRVAVLGTCWLIPMIPAGYWSYGSMIDEVKKQCFNYQSKQQRAIFFGIVLFTMTFVIIIIFSLSIITVRRLSKPQPTEAHFGEKQLAMIRKKTRSSVSMVLSSTLLYGCCWFPMIFWNCFYLLSFHFPDVFSFAFCIDLPSLHFILSDFLPAVNACFSPLIYIIFLSDFQEAAKRLLCC